jgi:hydroxyacylglutathione hydrolase
MVINYNRTDFMRHLLFPVLLLSLFSLGLTKQPELIIKSQKSGPFLVNSYLVYDPVSREAAFIDAGNVIDSLLGLIDNEHLKLKYIFLTHAHQDHITGVNTVLRKYPKTKFCLTREEFDDFKKYADWKTLFDQNSVEAWEKDSSIIRLMDFGYKGLRKPDIFLNDNGRFNLGKITLTMIKTPGHSRGSVTVSAGKNIFTGDLLLYHSTGFLDYVLCSKVEIVASIRKLYAFFPDETVVWPGHGKPSTIGYEKTGNKNVTVNKVTWE